MSLGLDDKLLEGMHRAESWYDHLSVLTRTRARLYASTNLTMRISALKSLVRSGGYGARPPSYPRLTGAMDATIGLAGLFPLIEKVTRRLARR
jgi:hypothetical protein